ncbi:MAG: Crp/Fnr family transcriptional regulator [Candidatus Lambdaproteobacteria bacterium]|nr:Crp/Fnr family transcriptional regulator [Candidatus Lambdaproteobacteria bacterium]
MGILASVNSNQGTTMLHAKAIELQGDRLLPPGLTVVTDSEPELRGAFEAHGKALTFRRHSAVYTPEDVAGHLYWICEGEVSLERSVLDGREFTLDHCGAGTVFGEIELLLEMPRQYAAVCRADAALLTLPRHKVMELRGADPGFAWTLNRILAERQSRLQARLEALLFRSAHGKVAQMLADLARDHGRPTREGMLIDYPITHQEIANLIAATRETVSHAFIEFRNSGLIATRERRTVILDLNKLNEIALV